MAVSTLRNAKFAHCDHVKHHGMMVMRTKHLNLTQNVFGIVLLKIGDWTADGRESTRSDGKGNCGEGEL